jgi:predicted esterase
MSRRQRVEELAITTKSKFRWCILPTGVGDNVLPIGSTSRVFVSSLRKNGYKVEFLESSGGHHVSRQVVDQAMSWLTAGFHQRG